MIIEQQVTASRTTATQRASAVSLGQRLAARPAIAGRERLAEALGESLVVQLMLVMSLVVFAALIYLNQASNVSVLQYQISDLTVQQSRLRQENAQLNAIRSHLKQPARISAAAQQMHMLSPDASNPVWVKVRVPIVHPLEPIASDLRTAETRSEPQSWVRRFVGLVGSAL
jgi:hypothetical protein